MDSAFGQGTGLSEPNEGWLLGPPLPPTSPLGAFNHQILWAGRRHDNDLSNITLAYV